MFPFFILISNIICQKLNKSIDFRFVKNSFVRSIQDGIRVTYVPSNIGSARIESLYSLSSEFKNQITFEYNVLFENGFEWSKGGKLPGLRGGNKIISTTGCVRPQPINAWSFRLMWGPMGTITMYTYDQKRNEQNIPCGISNYSKVPVLSIGKWINIKIYMKVNNQQNKGVAKLVINNKLISYRSNITWCPLNTTIDHIYFSTFYGGDDISWAPRNSTFIRFINPRIYNYDIV